MPTITNTLKPSAPILPLSTRLDAVHIGVTSAARALAVWRDVVGLEVIRETAAQIDLGIGTNVLIVLHLDSDQPVAPRTTGLYHVAIHVPQRRDLAGFVFRAAKANIRFSPTDHLVSEAVYIWDHDGNGIEVAFETPWRGRLQTPDDGDAYGLTADGRPHSGREPIDLDDLMSEITPDYNPMGLMPEGARVGHVHVHVNDLDQSMHFYRDVLGFGGQLLSYTFGMGDVALDYVPHILAFNVWNGPQAKPAPANTAGLRWYTIVLPDTATADALKIRLRDNDIALTERPDGFATTDPSGNSLHIMVEN